MEIRNLQRRERVDRRLVEAAATAALAAAGLAGHRVSVALVGDRRMRELNLRFRGKDRTTDVLSFPLPEEDYLGEVVISLETCRRQAEENGVPMDAELARLVIHGVIHLAGHDHERGKREAQRMRALEVRALALLAEQAP
jgi:rRNA maturation RNase YbeY